MITRTQIRMAYAALEMNMDDAAKFLRVGRASLQRAMRSQESYEVLSELTLQRLEDGFQKAGIEFHGEWLRKQEELR